MTLRSMLPLFAAALSIGLLSGAARADTVSLTLTNPTLTTTTGGGTLAFDATVFAPITNSGLEYLNGVSGNVASGASFDSSPFNANFPFFLNPGDSFTGEILDITLPAGSAVGNYLGSLTLDGGATDISNDVLGTVDFTVSVTSAATVTPEPSTWLLMATGALGMTALLRRRTAVL